MELAILSDANEYILVNCNFCDRFSGHILSFLVFPISFPEPDDLCMILFSNKEVTLAPTLNLLKLVVLRVVLKICWQGNFLNSFALVGSITVSISDNVDLKDALVSNEVQEFAISRMQHLFNSADTR